MPRLDKTVRPGSNILAPKFSNPAEEYRGMNQAREENTGKGERFFFLPMKINRAGTDRCFYLVGKFLYRLRWEGGL